MSDLIKAIAPLIGFWGLPLVPFFYAVFAATLEVVSSLVRREQTETVPVIDELVRSPQ